MSDIKRLRELLAKADVRFETNRYDDRAGDINWQLQDFKDPKRDCGCINISEAEFGARTKAVSDLIKSAVNALPGLLDRLEAAESRATRAAEEMREQAAKACEAVANEHFNEHGIEENPELTYPDDGRRRRRAVICKGETTAMNCVHRIRALPTAPRGDGT